MMIGPDPIIKIFLMSFRLGIVLRQGARLYAGPVDSSNFMVKAKLSNGASSLAGAIPSSCP